MNSANYKQGGLKPAQIKREYNFMTRDEKITELLSKQALMELCTDYARAVDRQDRMLMDSLWWPDARVDVGVYEGNALEYSEFITTANEGLKRSHHAMSNPTFQIAGTTAVGQVYVNAASTLVTEGRETENLVGGRYVDEFEQREGTWKFLFRAFVVDWAYSFDTAEVWASELVSVFKQGGTAAAGDFGHRQLSRQGR